MLFFVLLGLGFAAILCRYILAGTVDLFDNDWFMWGGLLSIFGGFAVATQWR